MLTVFKVNNKDTKTTSTAVIQVSLLITLSKFSTIISILIFSIFIVSLAQTLLADGFFAESKLIKKHYNYTNNRILASLMPTLDTARTLIWRFCQVSKLYFVMAETKQTLKKVVDIGNSFVSMLKDKKQPLKHTITTIMDKIFQTSSCFHVKQRTTGKVQFLFFRVFCQYRQILILEG